MASNTLTALNQLGKQVPGLHQKALKQVQAARDIGLQQQLGPQGQAAPQQQTAQQTASQQALQGGQDILAQRQASASQAVAIKSAAIKEQERTGLQSLAQRDMLQKQQMQQQQIAELNALRQEEQESRKFVTDEEIGTSARLQQLGIEMDNRLQLATEKQREDLQRIGSNVKMEILDSRLMFDASEDKRKFTNERQLADYTAATAKSKIDFDQKISDMQLAEERKGLVLQQAQAQLEAVLKRGYLKTKGDLDNESSLSIARYASEMRARAEREAARAKNNMAMRQAAGTIVGMGIVAASGGAAAPIMMGGALGGAAGTLTA